MALWTCAPGELFLGVFEPYTGEKCGAMDARAWKIRGEYSFQDTPEVISFLVFLLYFSASWEQKNICFAALDLPQQLGLKRNTLTILPDASVCVCVCATGLT